MCSLESKNATEVELKYSELFPFSSRTSVAEVKETDQGMASF